MTPEISKLKSLYQQLDHQQAAGDDVVAELKKEINNLELSYLKEQVLPQVAQFLASKVRDLRCDIDSSFQFDGQQNINYSFCTSGSMLFIKDSIDINSIPDLQGKISPESNEYSLPLIQSETKTDVVTYSFRIVDYSDKAVALFGDTRLFANDLKKLGGYFNPRLRGGAGWIFSKKKKVALIELLSPYLNEVKSISPTENKLKEQFPNNKPKLSREEWMNLISSMKCMKHKGYIAPHKAIFILTIIEAIKNKKIVENRIFPSTSLSDIFNRLWCEYVSIDLPFKSNFYQPFIHMEGEPFYDLIRLDGIDKFDINQNWNRNNVLQYVEYGVLNSELFKYLFDENFSLSLKNKLVEKYLSQQKISNLTTTKNEFKGKKEDNDIFKTFKRYLYTLKSNKGKPYSESSINVFLGALKSKYITEKLLKISGYENLGKVDDIKIINELLSLIFFDYENGSKNIVTYQALKMYRDYFKQNEKDNSKKDTYKILTTTSSQFKENLENNTLPNKIVEIKSIHSEHIFIEGSNSENIFVDFINQIGSDLVKQMNINYLGANIIGSNPHPFYSDHCKLLSDGNWVNVSARPKTLANHIIKICNNLNMRVEIEINIGSRVIKIDNKNSLK